MSAPVKKEITCPDCGESVRVNALRCWNCGAFMNREVEAKFLQMQANPAPIMFSELPAAEIHEYVEEADASGDDDDFELTVPSSGSTQGPETVTTPAPRPQVVGPFSGSTATSKGTPIQSEADETSEVPHSVATGGDALLDIAMQEVAETRVRRQKKKSLTGGLRTPGGGLLIFCPYGCKIEVKEEHRGMQGKCPKCQAPFVVPVDPPRYKKSKSASPAESQSVSGKFSNWLNDMHLHVVSPEKLKLKADSLVKEFVEADLGFSQDHLIVAILQKKGGGLFGGGGPKKDDARAAIYQHLKVDGPLADTPAGEKYIFSAEDVKQIKIVQPAASRTDNMFHGIPVFGAGKIAIQFPFTEQSKDPLFVSMGITEYWEFAKVVEQCYGISDLAADTGLPSEPVFKDYFCHYTATKIKALEGVDLYKADPKAELVVAGYRCGACGLTVSEAGRAKENLGGKGGKGIAKTKCPKCSNKMGDNPLYTLKSLMEEPAMGGSAASS